jgi:hypothetical protein
MENKLQIAIPKERKTTWLIIAASVITFICLGSQEVKAQESVKINFTDTKTISDSTSIKPRKGAKKYIGIVLDENNDPLPGATITIKNSNYKTNTNSSGEFSINAKKGDVLVFSYVGYENVELKLKDNATSLKIFLNNHTKQGEVTIIKYKKD